MLGGESVWLSKPLGKVTVEQHAHKVISEPILPQVKLNMVIEVVKIKRRVDISLIEIRG